MNFKIYFFVLFSFLIQLSYGQKSVDVKYEAAKEAFYIENYEEAYLLIKEAKKIYKSIPPKVAYLEILINDKLIKNNPYNDFLILDETRKLVKIYKNKYVKFQDEKYKEIIQIGDSLNQYPKDLETFNAIKEVKQRQEALEREQKLRELALEKERIEKQALEAKQKAEADRIKKIEEDKKKRIISDRKDRLRPYVNPETFSEYELARLSESEFNEQLDKAIRESVGKKEQEKKIKEIENQRLTILQPYLSYVNSYDTYNLGTYTEKRFEEIYNKAKSEFKAAEKRNRPQLGSFSSLGFQSGEIAKYGFIYERGGKKTVGFRISARTSLTSEQDIINGTAIKNKTEIELGPNFRILNRLYLNIGVGYGYYDRLFNNDFAGVVNVEKTGYSVATTGLMFRVSRLININSGLSFMNIEKEFYKPEMTLGISFNLKNKNDSERNSYTTQMKSKSNNNYNSNLSSFSSLGFYGGKNAKYGLFYETGGNGVTGFHVSARTSLKEETIINGQLILNRSELALGPNFRMSNRLYLNLGVGYGICDYGFSNDNYLGTSDYFSANAGIMLRLSRFININAGYSFENFDIEYHKPEITFGISFNIWE